MAEPVWCCKIMVWGCEPPLTASHILIGCMQSVLAPWDAVDGHMGTPLHCYAHMEGMDFRKIGAWLSPSDAVVSWLRLQTPKDCIPQSWHIYAKCFSSLRCCGWAYGYTLMPYYMCWWGWILGKMGHGWSCMMLWCHGWGCKPPKTASHIHIGCIQSVLAPWDAVDEHMNTPLHCYAHMEGMDFRKIGAWLSPSDVVVSWLRQQTPKDCIPQPLHICKEF
jgi:hypothetical protein